MRLQYVYLRRGTKKYLEGFSATEALAAELLATKGLGGPEELRLEIHHLNVDREHQSLLKWTEKYRTDDVPTLMAWPMPRREYMAASGTAAWGLPLGAIVEVPTSCRDEPSIPRQDNDRSDFPSDFLVLSSPAAPVCLVRSRSEQ